MTRKPVPMHESVWGIVMLVVFVVIAAIVGFVLGLGSDPGPALQPEPTSAITSTTHVLRDGTEVQCVTWYADASDEATAERECFITGTQLPTLPAD